MSACISWLSPSLTWQQSIYISSPSSCTFIIIKVDALWFGCYRVIIWFLSGKDESKWFFAFQLERHFLPYSCAHFSAGILRKSIITHKRSRHLGVIRLVIMCYTFHAHCCVIYHRTQDADAFWEGENFIKFPSKIDRFCHFFMKSKTSTPFFYFIILKYLRQTLT